MALNQTLESRSSTTADADGPDDCDQAQPASSYQQAPEWRNLGDHLSANPDGQSHTTGPDVAVSVLDEDRQARRSEDFHAKRECGAIDRHSRYSPRDQGDTCDRPVVSGYIKPLPGWLSSDDHDYLLRKEALTIPTDPLRTQLLQGFIEYVYVYMPLLDLNELLQAIDLEGKDSAPRISILLFQAIMFAGAAFVDMEHLRAGGYRTRRAARQELFDRVKVRI